MAQVAPFFTNELDTGATTSTGRRLRNVCFLLGAALAAGICFQWLTTVAALAFVRPFDAAFRQQEISDHPHSPVGYFHTPADFATVFAHNLGSLTAFAFGAILLAGWRGTPPRLGALVATFLIVYTGVVLARQSAIVMRLFPPIPEADGQVRAHASYLRLPLFLPHGALELAALLLPLVVGIRRSPGSVLRALPVSICLLLAAAAVETWVSPHLLEQAVWPS